MMNKEDLEEFEDQLKQVKEQEVTGTDKCDFGRTKTDEDGTVFEWDCMKKAWFPKIDDDFIAAYQMNYGVDVPSAGDVNPNKAGNDLTNDADADTKAKEYEQYCNDYYNWYYSNQGTMAGQEGGMDQQVSAEPAEKENEGKDTEGKDTDEGKVDEEGKESEGKDSVASADTKTDEAKTLDEYAAYYAYYYGQEYADYYKKYYSQPQEDGAQGQVANSDDWEVKYGPGTEKPEVSSMDTGDKKDDADNNTTDSKGDNSKKKKRKGGKADDPDAKKKKEPPPPPAWFDVVEEKNTSVYVSGLPSDVTDDEFLELMTKYGLIAHDPVLKRPKIKLYKDRDGNPKGDGLCGFIKNESVELALQLLDGLDIRGSKVAAELAKFELKGEFDPTKKKKKISGKAKRKFKERQEALFDWRPEKILESTRPKWEKSVVLKNLFDPKDFEEEPTLINDLRQDVQMECANFGEVKKVQVFDHHTDGVVLVHYKTPEEADLCVQSLRGRWFAKRRIIAQTWDGKTKYEVQESEADREKRLKKWDEFLSGDGKTETAKEGLEGKTETPEEKTGKDDVKTGDASLKLEKDDSAMETNDGKGDSKDSIDTDTGSNDVSISSGAYSDKTNHSNPSNDSNKSDDTNNITPSNDSNNADENTSQISNVEIVVTGSSGPPSNSSEAQSVVDDESGDVTGAAEVVDPVAMEMSGGGSEEVRAAGAGEDS